MSGALAERVFAHKLERVGFREVWIGEHADVGIDDSEGSPLFTDEVLELMRTLIPPERHHRVATSVIVKARKPA